MFSSDHVPKQKKKNYHTHFVVLVLLVHPALALGFGNDLSCVLHDDLVGFESAIASYTVATVRGLDDLDTHTIGTTLLGAFLQVLERAVLAAVFADIAVGVVALIQHDAVLTILCASVVTLANTLRLVVLEVIRLAPV